MSTENNEMRGKKVTLSNEKCLPLNESRQQLDKLEYPKDLIQIVKIASCELLHVLEKNPNPLECLFSWILNHNPYFIVVLNIALQMDYKVYDRSESDWPLNSHSKEVIDRLKDCKNKFHLLVRSATNLPILMAICWILLIKLGDESHATFHELYKEIKLYIDNQIFSDK